MLTAAQLLSGAVTPLAALTGISVCFFAGLPGGLSGYGTGVLVTLFIALGVGRKAPILMITVLPILTTAAGVGRAGDPHRVKSGSVHQS